MQINENINASNFLSIGTNASDITKSSKTNDSAGSDFASFLKAPKQQTTSPDPVKTSEVKSTNKTVERKDYQDNVQVRRDEPDNDTASVPANRDTEKSNVQEGTTEDYSVTDDNNSVVSAVEVTDDISKEDMEAVTEILGNILQLVSDTFNVPFEQIKDTMNELGLNPENMIAEADVKNMFLEFKSADVSDLLTDESLRAELQDFMNDMNQLLQGLPMPVRQASEIIGEQGIDFEDIVRIIDIGRKVEDEVKAFDNDAPVPDVITDNDEPSVIVNDERTTSDRESDSMEFSSETRKDVNNEVKSDVRKTTANDDTDRRDFANPILQNVADAVSQVEDVNVVNESNVRPVNIVDQIVEQVRVNMNQESTSMEMQLYPEHLGRIQIHVVSKDGVMTARIAAETESAKQAIEAGLNNLKESLQNQNLKVDAIEVMVSTTGFASSEERQEQYEQQGTGNRGRRLGFSDVEEDGIDEEEEAERLRAEGSSVSYRA